jgi:hypothetical protein
MSTPDLTRADYSAAALLLGALAATDDHVAIVCATLLGVALVIGDALRRRGRARIVEAETLAYGVDVTGAMDELEVAL